MNDMDSFLGGGMLDALLSLFPTSPFSQFMDDIASMPYLGYVNWFIPVGRMLDVGTAWLAAIALYYMYSIVARWVKLIS